MNAIVFPEFTVSQLTKSVPNPASGVLIVFVRDSLKAFSCVVYALRLENATMDGASGSETLERVSRGQRLGLGSGERCADRSGGSGLHPAGVELGNGGRLGLVFGCFLATWRTASDKSGFAALLIGRCF